MILRLRDLRRIIARLRRCAAQGHDAVFDRCRTCGRIFSVPRLPGNLAEAGRFCDRLISLYGPDAEAWDAYLRDKRAERKKNTDEVAPATSQTSAIAHGGDGNSGEVDSPSETASETPREPGSPVTSAAADGPEDRSAVDPVSGASRGGKADEPAEPTADPDGTGSTGAGNARPDKSGESSMGLEAVRLSEDAGIGDAPETEGEAPSPHVAPADGPGGCYVTWAISEARKNAHGRTARRMHTALRRIVLAMRGAAGDPSPRVDGRRLVREIVSRRMSLGRARREEIVHRTVIVAVDWSGSCSSVCTDLLAATLAIADTDREVIVVGHSNGWPEYVSRGKLPIYGEGASWDTIAGWWVDYIRHHDVAAVFALGDADALRQYEAIGAETDLWWLDNWAAKHGPRQHRGREAMYRRTIPRLKRYLVGVSGESFLAAIRLLERC